MSLPRLSVQTFLQIQQEANYNVAPAAGSAPYTGLDVFNVRFTPNLAFAPRQQQSGSGRAKGTFGPSFGTVTFSSNVFGAASNTWASLLLPGCGWWNDSGTYVPTLIPPQAPGSPSKSLTFRWYADGMMHLLRGAMGDWTLNCPAGDPLRMDWSFQGTYERAIDASNPTYSMPSADPIEGASGAFTVGAYSPIHRDLTISANNVLTPRRSGNAADGGAYGAVVTNRAVDGTMAIEAQLHGVYDPEEDMHGRVTRALSAAFGSAGNIITAAAPALQVSNVEVGDQDGIMIHTVSFQCGRVAGGDGDDELTLALT